MSTIKTLLTRVLSLTAVSLIFAAQAVTAGGSPKEVPRDPFGLKLGMPEVAVEQLLREIATQEKEEGEVERIRRQEVWNLKRDSQFRYLITRYNRERQLSLLTVVAHPKRVRYSDVGRLSEATFATDGVNLAYTWKRPLAGDERQTYIKARGSNRRFLTSFVISYSR